MAIDASSSGAATRRLRLGMVGGGPGGLVLGGVLSLCVQVGDRLSAELAGAGDLFQPVSDETDQLLAPVLAWRALTPMRFALLDDAFARRVRLTSPAAEALATAGAFGCFGVDRRAALWAAGVLAGQRPTQLPGTTVGIEAPPLPGMTEAELTVADVWATGISPDSHPIEHLRERLTAESAVPIAALRTVEDELADPAAWSSPERSARSQRKHDRAKRRVDELMAAWEAVAS